MVHNRTSRCVVHAAEHLPYLHPQHCRRRHHHRHRHYRRCHLPVLRRHSSTNGEKNTAVMVTGATLVTYRSSNDAPKDGTHQAQETTRVSIEYACEMKFMLTFTSVASHQLNREHHRDSTRFDLFPPTDFRRLRSTVSLLSGCHILTSCSSPLVAMMGKCG